MLTVGSCLHVAMLSARQSGPCSAVLFDVVELISQTGINGGGQEGSSLIVLVHDDSKVITSMPSADGAAFTWPALLGALLASSLRGSRGNKVSCSLAAPGQWNSSNYLDGPE